MRCLTRSMLTTWPSVQRTDHYDGHLGREGRHCDQLEASRRDLPNVGNHRSARFQSHLRPRHMYILTVGFFARSLVEQLVSSHRDASQRSSCAA